MVEQLKVFLSENSKAWGLPAAGRWRFWLYNNWHPHCTNLDIMWFHGNEEYPRVVTKLDRQQGRLSREFENLSNVYSCVPHLVPRPLHFGRFDDFWGLWLGGVPGAPFLADHSPKRFQLTIETLVAIHSGLRRLSGVAGGERYRRTVVEPFATVARFGTSEAVRAGCARLSKRIDEKWLDSLPPIPQHGDFYPDNIISSRGRQYVLDWETYGSVDLPFYDLLTFLVSLLIPIRTVPAELDPNIVRQVPTLLNLYANGIGIPAPELQFLLPLVLVNWFQLMWLDGRHKFTTQMYGLIEHFFEHPSIWRQLIHAASAK